MSTKRKIISALLAIVCLFLISQVIFHGKYVPLYGENQYSFSYSGHIKWILQDWIENPSILLQSHKCEDCQYFGMYSRWVMLWLYLILLPGEILKINPFVWYVFISIAFQFIGVKYFIESAFKTNTFDNRFIIFLSLFFSTIPYKWVQITTQWEYPIVYFMFFVLIGTCIRIINKERLFRSNIVLSQIAAVFIFNVGINHLPILFYTLLLLITYALVKNRDHVKEIMMSLILIFFPSLIINTPMLLSLILNEDITRYEGFHTNSWLSIISYGYLSSESNSILIFFIIGIGIAVTVMAINHFGKKDLYKFLSLAAGGIAITLFGKGLIYQMIFDNIPLFETLRSAYRFIIFAHLFLLLIISHLYLIYQSNKNKYRNLKILFIILFVLNIFNITESIKKFNFTEIPDSYRETQYYISDLATDRFLYFPTQLQLHHHVSMDYTYGNPHGEFYWWQNPFESWYPSRNVRHPTENMTASQLNEKVAILYKENKQEELVTLLKLAGVDAIIFDRYYNWEREAPMFDIEEFLSQAELRKSEQFDKIGIYYID